MDDKDQNSSDNKIQDIQPGVRPSQPSKPSQITVTGDDDEGTTTSVTSEEVIVPEVSDESSPETEDLSSDEPNDEPSDEPTEDPLQSPEVPALSEPSSDSGDDDASTATDTPPLVTAQAGIITSDKKPNKGRQAALLVVFLLILAALGGGAYYWFSVRTPAAKKTAASVVVKKDIPNIRYVSASYGFESFYPGIDDSANYTESNIMVFEGLVRFDNKTQIVPLLSTGWTNPDSSTWVFNLRNDVKFHDGRTMTAQDVKNSFDAAKDSDMGQILANSITSVTVSGTNQVTIKTDGPDPTLLKKLTLYYVYDTKSGKQNDPVNGTGPFTIKPGTTATPKSLELVAFDKYWGGRPHVRSFSFSGIDNYDHGKAYGDNKADLESMFADKATETGTRKYAQQALDQASVFIMPLNTLKAGSPLAKLPVRQAIQLAMDPAAIAKVRSTNAIPASQIVPSSIPGYDPSIKRPTRDVAKAKELLKEAGYPNGFTFTLTYFKPSQATADEMLKEFAEAGITMKEDVQTVPQDMITKYNSGKTDAVIVTYTSDIFDATDVLSTYNGTADYNNPTVTDLVTKANSTLDSTKRLGYLKQASHAMATDLGTEPIFVESGDSIIYDPSYVIQRDIANNSLGIYFQKVYAK